MLTLTGDCFHVQVRLLTALFFLTYYLFDGCVIIIIYYFLTLLAHIYLFILFLHFALEFARFPYRILQIKYVYVDVDV